MFKKTIFIMALCATLPLFCMIKLSDLSLEQKIGQLFMVSAVTEEDLAQECIQKKTYRMDKE